jgi:hypothetical protein
MALLSLAIIIPRDKLIEAAQECPHYFAVE